MKKTITLMAFALGMFTIKAQTVVADFESFTLADSSVYTSTVSAPFITSDASFEYKWDTTYNYWAGGFAYTNRHDSSTAGAGNLYGVKPLKGYNNSNIFVVCQDQGVIKLSAPSNTVSGFYITNTTFAYKSMKNGDQFAKKFGGTTGNDPDFFKVTVKGYKNGVLLQDSVPFYLADFRFANNTLDYIVSNWQWVNTSTLGNVDSLKFFMYSSDVGSFGINTPLYFAIDNFTTIQSPVGLAEHTNNLKANVYPSPFTSALTIELTSVAEIVNVTLTDVTGKIVFSQNLNSLENSIDVSTLNSGVYFLQLVSGDKKAIKKVIKN